jgi:raffinose/stachyose/melibiose transport system substrate-binding protein
VKKAGVIPFAPAFSECQPCLEWAVTVMLSHYAGPEKVYQALSGKLPWTDPAFEEAITKLNTWMQDGWFMGGKSYLFSDTFDTSHAMFGSGKIAMNFEGTWFQASINDFFGEKGSNKNDWDWFPIPTTFSKDPFFVIGIGSSWGVNAASKNKDATAEVMDYIFSQATQLGLFTKCGKAPAPVNLSTELFKDSDPRIARLYDAMSTASASGKYGYTTWTFWPPKTNVFVYDGIAKVYDGKMTVKDYLAEMQKLFKEEFDKGLIPPLPPRK